MRIAESPRVVVAKSRATYRRSLRFGALVGIRTSLT